MLAIQRRVPAAACGGSADELAPSVYLYDKYDVRLAGALHSEDYGDHAAHITNGNKDPAAVCVCVCVCVCMCAPKALHEFSVW